MSDDARRALADIERVQGKAQAFQAYAQAWPAFLIWGLVWLSANLATYFAPALGAWVWRVGVAAGIIASVWLGAAMARRAGKRIRFDRSAVMAAVIFAGLAAIFTITGTREHDEVNAVISLLAAMVYMLVGLHRGARLFAIGFAVGASVLLGWFFARDAFALWMGLAGGGALILTGLWLRTE